MDILVLLLCLDLLLGADREEISVQGNVDVLPLKSGQFGGNLDVLIGFGNLNSRREHSRAVGRNGQRASKIEKEPVNFPPQGVEGIEVRGRESRTRSEWNKRLQVHSC